ncbi:MAG: 2-C-methyl-D-erythritol 4-phosphate cytidylyltransferase [Marinilabiliaceae bacterium]|jgi:2-C-methyl-D-erythritol 4-phosphate cytidylyltransferase|nr:2-C-methyl-D-erythritol 4-phosphate cytidylyltransferase [Marinilabiliaceae bacterium]
MAERQRFLIIMAGGTGKRMGYNIPKQFIEIQGRPVILHSIDRFLEFDKSLEIVVVLPASEFETWQKICTRHNVGFKHKIVEGGDERFYSVKNGIKATGLDSVIAIHDSVRPLVSLKTISDCFDMAERKGTAVPVIKLSESVRKEEGSGRNRPLDRESIRLVQTPQVFRGDILHLAYDCGFSPYFTDDATVVERLGEKINLVEGNRENIKITSPLDLKIAECLLEAGKS